MSAPIYPRRHYFQPSAFGHPIPGALALLVVVMAAGCSRETAVVEDVRPVRVMRTQPAETESAVEYPGEVRARVESRLGFRIGGKIVERKVEVGSLVRRGQVLMKLDPRDLQLAQAQASGGLKAAETSRDLAQSEFKRYQELRQKNFVSQAVLDGKEAALKSAQASHDQALAGYHNQINQASYAVLMADIEGVVTAVDAEVGQVVAPGAQVVRVAGAGEKEVVVSIPEDKVIELQEVDQIKVRTWVRPNNWFSGQLREVSPAADAATRTYSARIAIANAPPDIRLGMTAYASFITKSQRAVVRLPLSALFMHQAGSAVWVVDANTVRLVPVQVAGASGNDVLISGGLTAGQAVVTAGVNLLKPGQKVNILDDGSKETTTGASDQASAAIGIVQ